LVVQVCCFIIPVDYCTIRDDTIRDDIFTCAQKLTKSQLNLAHYTKNGRDKDERPHRHPVTHNGGE